MRCRDFFRFLIISGICLRCLHWTGLLYLLFYIVHCHWLLSLITRTLYSWTNACVKFSQFCCLLQASGWSRGSRGLDPPWAFQVTFPNRPDPLSFLGGGGLGLDRGTGSGVSVVAAATILWNVVCEGGYDLATTVFWQKWVKKQIALHAISLYSNYAFSHQF